VTSWSELDRFLQTDPRDVGCDEALRILHIYVELVLEDESAAEAARRYPGVVAHLLACDPCSDDLEGLLVAARTEGSAGPAERGIQETICYVHQSHEVDRLVHHAQLCQTTGDSIRLCPRLAGRAVMPLRS
jgi:hypothetical protein